MDARRRSHAGDPGNLRPDQAMGARTAGAADAGIPESPGRQHGGPGGRRARQLSHVPLPAERHAAHYDVRHEGIRHHARRRPSSCSAARITFVGSSPTDTATGRRIRSRALRAIQSDDGSTRMATASTTRSTKPRRATSGVRAPSMASGLPLAFDNQSIFFERLFLDRTKPNVLLHDLTTVVDHALTRPLDLRPALPRSGRQDGRAVARELVSQGRQRQHRHRQGEFMSCVPTAC